MVADSVIAFVLNLLEERPDETCPRWHLSRQALTKRKRVIWMRYCATVLKAKFLQCYLNRQIGFWRWTCSRENALLSRRQMKHYLETGIARDAVREQDNSPGISLCAYSPVRKRWQSQQTSPCLLGQLFPPMAVQFEAAGGWQSFLQQISKRHFLFWDLTGRRITCLQV